MRAVIPVIDPLILAQRKRFGVDQYDEMWEGELHMPPSPDYVHQDFEGELATYLRVHWAGPLKAKVVQQMNLARDGAGADWQSDYRIPDILLVTAERMGINKGSHFEGAPNAVVEIHSPGDEAYEKLPFYQNLGIPEVWIIHRDSKHTEIYLLRGDEYERSEPDAEGWSRSPTANVEMKPAPPTPPSQGGPKVCKLAIRVCGDNSTYAELPRIG